jgi:hypothetical protein
MRRDVPLKGCGDGPHAGDELGKKGLDLRAQADLVKINEKERRIRDDGLDGSVDDV